ncbi:MAG: hypothetical protein JWN95_2453 [Frankiales bacterium]|nr:hypothetical protein [Frankiales bacterium]
MRRTLTGGSALVLTIGLLSAAPPADAANLSPAYNVCSEDQKFTVTSRHADLLKALTPQFALVNNSASNATLSHALSLSGSVSLAVSASVGVDASVLLSTIKTQVSATATMTITASQSITGTMTVRPGRVGYIQGGILKLYDTGTAS